MTNVVETPAGSMQSMHHEAAIGRTAGQPKPGAVQSVSDLEEQVAYQRAFEAVVWAMPALGIHRFRQGLYEIPGVENNVVIAFSGTLKARHEVITANTAVPYIAAFLDLRGGPVVVEVPAANEKASLYGQVVDAWQVTIAGVGPSGPDQGAGGKYLFMPPGYQQANPEGYFPIRSTSYRLALAFRSVPGKGSTQADAYAYTQTLKVYPLSKAGDPPPTRFVDGLPLAIQTLPHYDIRALRDIHDFVSVEPVQERDKVMIGMLATIGIEIGKPFNPSPNLEAAMERGVVDAYYYMQGLTMKELQANLWWPDRHWAMVLNPDESGGFEFITDRAVEIDKRAATWFPAIFLPPKFDASAATVYISAIGDSDGNAVEAGKLYRIRIPKDIPAKQFWSITVYDRATWGFIFNPEDRSGLGMLDADRIQVNEDGSTDIYLGPRAPDGLECNWIPTADKIPVIWLRLYGPDESFWNRTFKMPDIEAV